MNQRRNLGMLGALVAASLLISAPVQAAKCGKGVHAAKLHRVTQIETRDVTVGRTPGTGQERARRQSQLESGRLVLMPNPDMERIVLLPNPDLERTVVLPNPE
jgi:hypothetical protein